MKALLLGVWLLSIAGCAAVLFGTPLPAAPVVVKGAGTPHALYERVERAARQLGAGHLEGTESDLFLGAIFDEEGRSRLHLLVQVTEWGQVSIEVRPEVRDEHDEWMTPRAEPAPSVRDRAREISDMVVAAIPPAKNV